MNRALPALATGLCLVLAGCAAPAAGIEVTGTVDDLTAVVVVPSLAVPAVSLDAGFGTTSGPHNPVTGRTATAASTVAASFGLGTRARLSDVVVREGDTVQAGQAVATTDTATHRAALAAAKADAAAAAAQVDVLAAAIDTTYDKEADVRDARDKVTDAIETIRDTRAKLLRTRKTLTRALPQLEAALAQVEAMISAYPPVPPPGYPSLAELQAKAAQLRAQRAKVKAGLKQIRQALPRLAAGLKKAKAGLARIDDGLADLGDARGTLRDLRELAQLQARSMTVPIDLVRTQLALAELTSPVAGVVVSVASAGDVLAPGATVVVVRETGPSTVTAWLSPAQLAGVCLGDPARITGDWMAGEGLDATLTRIGTRADYPPTSVATDEVHLTRAVEVVLTASGQLPAGVPVQISLQGCRPAADANDPNR